MTREAALVGRAAEQAVLTGVIAKVAERGVPAVVQVLGEPGIGKSRLLAEVAATADQRGFLVLASRAAELLQALPFGVIAGALDDHLQGLDLAGLPGLDPRWYPELATVLPAFVPLAGDRAPALHAERFQTHRAVRSLLEALSRTRNLAVILDDVHWADPASVELLVHLLAHPPAAPVLLAVGYRPAQVGPRLRAALAEAVREGVAEGVELGPLGADEVRELVRRRAPNVPFEGLYRDSGGNPFYLEQLLRGAGLAPSTQRINLTKDRVPAPVASALASELGALDAEARRLLEGAAVAGDPFDCELAAAAAEMEEGDALAWLDELLERDLIHPTVAPQRFRFRHPIVRRAIYESARPGWRLGAHARIAAALTDEGATAVALAPHVERSARRGDDAAIGVLVEAAADAERRAPATAAIWYDAAVRLLPETPDALVRRLELLARAATARGLAGQFEESHAALCAVLELVPEGAEGRLGLVVFCAAIERLQGRVDDARRRLTQALANVPTPAEAAALRVELAIDAYVSCDYPAMRSWAERSLEAARAIDDPLAEACAAAILHLAEHNMGGVPSTANLDRARSLIEAMPDERLAVRLDAATWLGYAELSAERCAEADSHFRRVVQVARTTGRGQYIGMTLIGQLYGLMFTGRLDEAERVAEAAVDTFGPAGEPALAEALCCRGFVRAARGDIAGAIRDGENAIERHKPRGYQPLLETASAIFLASFLIEDNGARRARDLLVARLGGPALPLTERRGRAAAFEILTRAEIELGDLDAADVCADRANATEGSGELPLHSAPARRAAALVLLARGDAAAAADVALLAAETTAAASPLESGRSRILAGRALAQAGERQPALVQLEQAERDLAACGAWFFRDQATAELRRLGLRRQSSQPRGDGALATLTERERLIAELVSQGKTNRDIASECFVSVKTVERHVAHLFDKLGVSSRAAVASIVAGKR